MNTQTSVMVKKYSNSENEPISLNWKWRAEELDETVVNGKGQISASQLVDQKVMNDISDYLWYMTRLVFDFIIFWYIFTYVVNQI